MYVLNRIVIVVSLLLLIACTKNESDFGPRSTGTDQLNLPTNRNIVIGNEGNFQWGNGSLSVYDPNSKSISNNVYKTLNNLPLGDVVQSINKFGNELYIVVNNSSKIEILDDKTFVKKRTISLHGKSPRYIEFINSSRAFVTELYANSILEINPLNGIVNKEIKVDGWTEKMTSNNTYVFIESKTAKQVLIYNKKENTWLPPCLLNEEPVGIFLTKNNEPFALDKHTLYSLDFDGDSFKPSIKLELKSDQEFGQNAFDPINNNVYYLYKGVHRLNLESLEINNILKATNQVFYGISIDPYLQEVYVTDAKDYVQNGTLYRISSEGKVLDKEETGLIPQHIFFNE